MDPWDWREWGSEAIEVIEEFCAAWLAYGTQLSPSGYPQVDAETMILTLERLGYDWLGYFKGLIHDGSAESLAGLIGLVSDMEEGKYQQSFLYDDPGACSSIEELLLAKSTIDALETAISDDACCPKHEPWLIAMHRFLKEGARSYFPHVDDSLR